MPVLCAAPYVEPAYETFLTQKSSLSIGAALASVDGYWHFMGADVTGIGLSDANASPPWLWPFGIRPIVCRWDSEGRKTAYIALVPNLAAWLFSLFGVIGGIWSVFARQMPGKHRFDRPLVLTLLGLWAIFMLSNAALAQFRVMYLYHYFLPLLFGWVLAATLLAGMHPQSIGTVVIPNIAAGLALAGFVLQAPFALHLPLTDQACRFRTIMNSANICSAGDPSDQAN